MNDSFINAMNCQKSTREWMNAIAENMINTYTPGFRENKVTFKTFLNSAIIDSVDKKEGQGKSLPGTSNENVYLEGQGYFLLRRDDGKRVYTRLGEFKFDKEGVYKNPNGYEVQGYILNDKGEIMQGTKPVDADIYNETALNGGTVDLPTTNIKLWIDPNNGKYLGKYDEFEIKEDGILYGKADDGKVTTPLYKIAIFNFNNVGGLKEVKDNIFIETEQSGLPVIGRGSIRSGLIEQSNVVMGDNISIFQQAKVQIELTNKLISTNKQLLEEALRLVGN
ncbi:MAG: hypothetical protein BHW64_02640 [Candidatus Melainabacteria bacterium LEY3_CP_29_8]|nr:MAG: hypothetical protein BHW64_02640 [Candidatus Melainabacteria bacterium LEY3_CP_29_8]